MSDIQAGLGQGFTQLAQIMMALRDASTQRKRYAAEDAFRNRQLSEETRIKQQQIETDKANAELAANTDISVEGMRDRRAQEQDIRQQKEGRLSRTQQGLTSLGIGTFDPEAISGLANAGKQLPGAPQRMQPNELARLAGISQPGQQLGNTSFFRAPNDPHLNVTTNSDDTDRTKIAAMREIRETEDDLRQRAMEQVRQDAISAGRNFDPNDDRNRIAMGHAADHAVEYWRRSEYGQQLYGMVGNAIPPTLGRVGGNVPSAAGVPAPSAGSASPAAPSGPPPLRPNVPAPAGPPPLRPAVQDTGSVPIPPRPSFTVPVDRPNYVPPANIPVGSGQLSPTQQDSLMASEGLPDSIQEVMRLMRNYGPRNRTARRSQ